MQGLGHESQVIRVAGDHWGFENIGYVGGLRLIEERALPSTTVFCSNDRLAIGFLAACYEKGVKVGRDSDCTLRVAGHDDHPYSRYTSPPLTTVAQDYELIARRSVETLFGLIDQGQPANRDERLFEGKLIMRQSA